MSKKKRWSKKSKILTWTLAPTMSVVLGGGTIMAAIAGMQVHKLHQEEDAFNKVLNMSNTSTDGKTNFDPGVKQDMKNENDFNNIYNKFFHATSFSAKSSSKSIDINTFDINLQYTMLDLFPQFLTKLQQVKTQINNSPLKDYPQMKLLKNGFVPDATNLIKTYQMNVKNPHNKPMLDNEEAFGVFVKGLGNLIYKYMAIPFNKQLSQTGDFNKYVKTPNKTNGQSLLITSLYDHTILDISNSLFRQSIEAPYIYIKQLVSEGYHIQKIKTDFPGYFATSYLKLLTGPIGIEHITDVLEVGSTMDGLITDVNNNLDNALSHPIFHKAKTNKDIQKIKDLTSLLRDTFNKFIEMPKNKTDDMVDSLNLYVKNGASTGGLNSFMNDELKTHKFTFLNDAVNSKQVYTASTSMKAFLFENATHYTSKSHSYLSDIKNMSLSSNWLIPITVI